MACAVVFTCDSAHPRSPVVVVTPTRFAYASAPNRPRCADDECSVVGDGTGGTLVVAGMTLPAEWQGTEDEPPAPRLGATAQCRDTRATHAGAPSMPVCSSSAERSPSSATATVTVSIYPTDETTSVTVVNWVGLPMREPRGHAVFSKRNYQKTPYPRDYLNEGAAAKIIQNDASGAPVLRARRSAFACVATASGRTAHVNTTGAGVGERVDDFVA